MEKSENGRRKFTAQEKVGILRRHFLEKVPVSTLCDEQGLNPTVFYRRQKEFFENDAAAFERRPEGRERKLEEKVEALQGKLAKKDEVMAELLMEHAALKKVLGRREGRRPTARLAAHSTLLRAALSFTEWAASPADTHKPERIHRRGGGARRETTLSQEPGGE